MEPVVLPDMDRLATFLAVVDTGSFRKAAALRFLSHSTVQKQMRSLERDLKFDLFDRSGRNVVIKSRGHDLAEAVRSTVQACSDLQAEIERIQTTAQTKLRIGTVPVHVANQLGVAVRSIDTDTDLVLLSSSQMANDATLVSLLKNATVDVVITIRALPSCKTAKLWPLDLVAVTPDDFIARRSKFISVEALKGATVFVQDTNMWSRQQLDRLIAESSVNINLITEPLPDVCLSLARAGMGVAVVASDNVPGGNTNVFPMKDHAGKAVRDDVKANWLASNEKTQQLRELIRFFSAQSGAA